LLKASDRIHHGRPKAIEEGVKYLLSYKPKHINHGYEQYVIALVIMALEAHNRKTHFDTIKELADQLVIRQDQSGGWGYGDFSKIKQDSGSGVPKMKIRTDVSITQYAVLGLFTARHSGVKIEDKVFQKALSWILKAQFWEGGWSCCQQGGGLTFKSRASGVNLNMTAAGLGTVLLCQSALGKNLGDSREEHVKASVSKAMELLEKHWKDRQQSSYYCPYYHFYYLYALERAMTAMGREKIGKDDWYYHAAEYLILPFQAKDGSFEIRTTFYISQDKNLQTGFSLLFLSRATESLFTH
jgi:hypothetical protein